MYSGQDDDGFLRFGGTGRLAGATAVTFFEVYDRREGVLNFGKDVANRIVWAPSHTGRAVAILTEQADVHINSRQPDFNLRFLS